MRVIIIDDEQLALEFLERQLEKISNLEVIGKYLNPLAGMERITQSEVDVVFLDINMPGINGIDLAGKILEHKAHISIVFVTAYDKYAISAFELNALDYILKPIQLDRLNNTINRIRMQKSRDLNIVQHENAIYISVAGQLKVGRSRAEMKVLAWRTAKTQELFLYLLENRHQVIRKSMLAELLWPTFDQERAYAQLYTSIYHVRKVMRKFGAHFKIKSKMDGYILELTDVWIDLNEWETVVNTLQNVTHATIRSYENVMNIYTGAYLEVYDYIWAEVERYRLERLWLKTALRMARFYNDEGQVVEAIDWYKIICTRIPETEEAHFSLMVIYDLLNQESFVKQQYIELSNILDEELGVSPSMHIVTWYEQWERRLSAEK